MNAAKCLAIYRILQRANPNPRTELNYHNPFELLIAVMLSAQTTDIAVNKVTRVLFVAANTPQALLDLGEVKLRDYIQSIGLFRNKAKYIMQTCARLIEQHDGCVPGCREDLEALPGVGRKTANVILNTLFAQPQIAVDTHIFRVANRTGLAIGKTPLAVEKTLLKTTPKQFLVCAHHWLVLHGRYCCKARVPECARCLIYAYCEFSDKEKYRQSL